MALVLADRVLETTVVTGTGDAALAGAVVGYQPFSTVGNGNTTYYTIVAIDANGTPTGDWEVGIGTYVLAGNKISRNTVLSSSNGGALVYFPTGTKQIFLDLPSEEVLLTAGDVTGPASAVANNFAAFNLTTGKLIKDSGYSSASFATAAQGALADTAVQPGDLGTAAYLDAGSALGVATLDAGGKVPTSQIPQMGDLNYQGTWNASTNTPALTSSVGTKGYYYVVSVAGSTNLNGITDWLVGDWAVFNGSVWEQIDNTDAVTSVNGYTGTVVLTASDVGAAPATSGTSILYGNGTGGFSNVTVGSGLSFTGGTLASSGGGDVVGPASSTDNAIARFDTTTGKLLQNSVVTIDDSGNISGANSISTIDYAQLDTAAAASIALGKLRWNTDTATAAFGIIDGTTEVNIGQQMYAYVTNAESVTITAGQAVYLYQATGNRASVKLAYNTGDATSAKTLGLVTADIAAGATGFVTTQGVLGKLNTGAYTEGDTLYLGATAGSLTATKPKAPNHLVYIGVVERANNGNGQIYVRVQNGYELDEIHDVQINSPADGQTILYDASTSLWKNANLTAGTGISIANGAASVTITNSAPDQVVSLTGAGTTNVTGTYPNFTITSNDAYTGTVTSVTAGTGLSGGTITTSGTIDLANTAVTAGSYTYASITVDAQGRLTSASNGASPSAFPSGTAMLFAQTSAPTGWTKSTTHDNKALRVVSGTASSGGSVAFTTAFASQTPTGTVSVSVTAGNLAVGAGTFAVSATTLSSNEIPAHAHQLSANGAVTAAGVDPYNTFTRTTGSFMGAASAGANNRNNGTSNAGGGSSHSHGLSGAPSLSGAPTVTSASFSGNAINLAVQYVDVIIATKD